MVLNFNKTLAQALQEIAFQEEHYQYPVHQTEIVRTENPNCEIIDKYGKAKWALVDLLNQKYSTVLKDKIDLYNWLNYNEQDEVSYFLNEAGSNCLNYAQFKAPYKFHLWLGEKGFIVAIEQKGQSFNALEVAEKNIKENEGAAFHFFKKCKSEIFFDNSEETNIVFMEMLCCQ